jgi:hypothetical protein
MPSSISSPDSADPPGRVRRIVLWVGLLTGPLAWLLSLELGYALSYASCAEHTTWFLHLATLAPLALVVASAATLFVMHPWRADAAHGWTGWIARAGLISSLWFALVIAATDLPIYVVHPCL